MNREQNIKFFLSEHAIKQDHLAAEGRLKKLSRFVLLIAALLLFVFIIIIAK